MLKSVASLLVLCGLNPINHGVKAVEMNQEALRKGRRPTVQASANFIDLDVRENNKYTGQIYVGS
jgi:uncharacterized protein (DUF305 family)